MSHNKQHLGSASAQEKQETTHAEESWSYDSETYWTQVIEGWSSYVPTMGVMVITHHVIGAIGHIMFPLKN